MLVLSRRTNQTIVIDGGIEVTVIAINNHTVRLGFKAPDHVHILRQELADRVHNQITPEPVAVTTDTLPGRVPFEPTPHHTMAGAWAGGKG